MCVGDLHPEVVQRLVDALQDGEGQAWQVSEMGDGDRAVNKDVPDRSIGAERQEERLDAMRTAAVGELHHELFQAPDVEAVDEVGDANPRRLSLVVHIPRPGVRATRAGLGRLREKLIAAGRVCDWGG
jgi:hypothetical protein